MSYLSLQRLSKTYGTSVAVSEMSIEIEKSEFVSILGPSGCGKTTTLQMIAGFVEPTSGDIVLDGQTMTNVPANRRGLGIVFQNYALFPHMTVDENVAFGLKMRGLGRARRKAQVAETLDLVGLAHLAERYPAQLSGGQQQRVALARAMVIKPNVLLLDEPLSNLDAKLREEMQIELRAIQRTLGTTTVLVTHDQNEALALSDRIVVMNHGVVEQIAEPYNVYDRPGSRFVGGFLGKTNVFDVALADLDGRPHGRVGDAVFPLDGMDLVAGPAMLRPEKIRFAQGGPHTLSGRLATRIFQGSHWMCQVDTAVGTVLVMAPNDGAPVADEGATVHLGWQAADLRAAPARPE
ncbi:MAG: ABC transporter ATP-binding protein [Acuticoccus sp.]